MALTGKRDLSRPLYRRTVLENGLRIVTEHIPTARSLSVGVWIWTGSRDEAKEENGISHFIEHMVFKGTRHRRMYHIAQRMEAVGGYLNAYTSKEYTCYYARSLHEHLKRAIDITTDLVLNATFPERELEREKGVVIEEIKMYDDVPEDAVFDRLEGVLYRDHSLGRPIVGIPETVGAFTREQLVSYRDTRYIPGRMVIALAGNVEHDRAVALTRAAFEDKFDRNGVNGGDLDRPPANGYQPEHIVETRPTQQAHLVLGTRAYGANDSRRHALRLMNTVLGSGMSSRLNQNIREKYGYCYSIYSFVNMLSDTGEFGVYMGTDVSKVERSRKLILREFDRLAQKPIGRQRLAQAKNQLKGAVVLGLEDLSNRMMRLGRLELYHQRHFNVDDILDAIESVTQDDLDIVVEDLLHPERYSTIAFVPN